MDLSKIITELRMELECLNTAIASMEELARVQNLVDAGDQPTPPSGPGRIAGEPGQSETPQDAAPVKRPRGRPRKHPVASTEEAPKPMGMDSADTAEESTTFQVA